jgi:hypothetical protein
MRVLYMCWLNCGLQTGDLSIQQNPSWKTCCRSSNQEWDLRFSRWRVWSLDSSGIRFFRFFCSHVEVYRLFRGTYCLTLMMETVCISETSVNFNVTTLCYFPEDSKLNEISGSHGGEYEVDSLLEYSAVLSRWSRPTFQRFVLPRISGW